MPSSSLVRGFLTCALLRAVHGQLGPQSPLSRLAPSYAQLCTTVNSDGSFSANPSACSYNYGCAADPYRGGAFYCGIGGASCASNAECANFGNNACVSGTCRGGYGQHFFDAGSAGPDAVYEGCLDELSPNGAGTCGGIYASCFQQGTGIPNDAYCASGVCSGSGISAPCANTFAAVGAACDPSEGYRCGTAGAGGTELYCRTSDKTCQPLVGLGGDCDATSACSPPYYCSTSVSSVDNQHKCVAQMNAVGASCDMDPSEQCGTDPHLGALFCQAGANGNTCQRIGTYEYSSCYGDLSGNACASPRYCTGPNAPAGSQSQCRTKASLGGSCRFDPANGCSTGLYCTSTDQTCQAISTAAGQSCGTDSNACSASADLYCVASTQLCAQKATSVGASCSFDLTDGCSSTSSGQQLYCRSSDATCQVRLTTVGADCRADPISACGTATATDGSTISLYCGAPSYLCACSSPYYCSSNNDVCISQVTTVGSTCNDDPYTQCGLNPSYAYPGYNGQLYPSIEVDKNGNQVCFCFQQRGSASVTPPQGTFGLTAVGDSCSSDPSFACGYTAGGVKLYCVLSTNTCQAHVTTVGGSCAYDYLGACGITTDGTHTQLYPSIPVGSSGHADCTCVTQADVVVRPSSRARARARARRNLSLCPGSHTACPVGSGFECIDTENNLEQCGGCSEQGGVDCTSLPGVAAVGCVGGRCEIWACEEGFEFNPENEQCARP